MKEKLDKVLLFLVWNECNNFCKFCVNKEIYNITTEEKIRNLSIILQKLKNIEAGQYDTIGLIGGEFFQGQLKDFTVKTMFFDIFKMLNIMIKNHIIKHIWITATLISKNQDDLFSCLKLIDDISTVWICTSYDINGRFMTDASLLSWHNNMVKLKETYPNININTTSILSGSFIKAYLDGTFSIKDFCKTYSTTWFGKPPNIPVNCQLTKQQFNDIVLKDFFPKRQLFLSFLHKFKMNESQFDFDFRLFSNMLRADALVQPNINNTDQRAIMVRDKITNEEHLEIIDNNDYLKDNNTAMKQKDIEHNCIHNSSYTPYVDSDKCFYCDKELINEL